MVVHSRYYLLGISLFAFLVLDSELSADVDSFKLYFVVDFIPSEDADFFSSSVELSKSSSPYFVDMNLWFDTLVIASLGLTALDLSVGAAESLGISFGIIQVRYFLQLFVVDLFNDQLCDSVFALHLVWLVFLINYYQLDFTSVIGVDYTCVGCESVFDC